MTKFVAFLRGINVGGHRKVPMATLKTDCVAAGLDHVQSYIASGNLAFKGDRSSDECATIIADVIRDGFGFDVPVLVLAEKEMRAVLKSCPYPLDPGKLVHGYLCYDDPSPDWDEIGKLRTDTEEVAADGRVVWLHAPDGIGRSKLAAKMERLIGVEATARNLNTIIKMVDILDT